MYQIIGGSENGTIGIKIEKKLTQDDYELLLPYIETQRQKAEWVSLLCDLSECEDPTIHTLWGDLVDRLHQLYEIPRVAIVLGEHQWMESSTIASTPLHNATVKCFTQSQLEMAWNWVEEDQR